MRKFTTIMVSVLTFLTLGARENRPSDANRRELEILSQPFSLTNNTAGMGLFQPSPGSETKIRLFSESGDFRLAQQGDGDSGFRFSTLRYDTFSDKLFMRGSFHYMFDTEKNRRWSDVMDPWFSIPYIYGSAVAKDYDRHDCGLSFDLYTAPLSGHVSTGVKVDYNVSDISGMRDPRPRTGYLNYRIIPSVLFSWGRHHVGFDAGYGYSKEKLSNLTTIQSYPNLYYYKMSGMEHVEGTIAGYSGFKRQFVDNRFISDLSYGFSAGGLDVLVSGGLEYSRMNAYGDNLQTPGSFDYIEFNGIADVTLKRKSFVHNFRLEGRYKDGGADERLQERISVKDPETGVSTETWETIYVYKNRYMLKRGFLSAGYRLFGGYSGQDYLWKAGVTLGFNGFDKDFYLPHSSFSVSACTAGADGSVRIFSRKGHKVELLADVKASKSIDSTLSLQENNVYAEEVLKPDREYYASDWISAAGGLVWQFPLDLGKAGSASGYLRLDGGTCLAGSAGSRSCISVTAGIFTF